MRNTLLTIVILSCLAATSMAADRREDGQQQSKQVKQTQAARDGQQQSKQAQQMQVARNDADSSSKDDHASSRKSDCTQKPAEGDPEAPQNKVEYGGGG